MKKVLLAIIFLLTTVVSGYYIFIWNPEVVPAEAPVEKNVIQLEEKTTVNNNNGKNVFKYTNKTLGEAFSEEDKKSILNYVSKLSFTDQILVDEYIDSSNQYDNVKLLVKIFKGRFAKDEYNNIKVILNKYLDINELEKVIN